MSLHAVRFTNLVDWLDNRLDTEARQRVETHLAGCPACQRDLAWLQRVIYAARSDDTVEPPAEAVAQVKALYRTRAKALAPARAAKLRPSIRVPRLAFALTLVLLVSAALYLTQVPMLFAREAMLTTVAGAAQARRMGDAQWQEAGSGEALRAGDEVRVVDGVAILALFDGSLLEMQAGSELAFSSLRSGLFGVTYQIVLQQAAGSVDYSVASLRSPLCRFEVHSPTARVAVRGTRFVITVQSQEQTHVAVLQGSVQVVNALTTTVLAEREVAIVPANAPLVYLPTLTPQPTATTTPSPWPSPTAPELPLPSVTPMPMPTMPQAEGIPHTPTTLPPSEMAAHGPSQTPTSMATASITPTSTVPPGSSRVHFHGTIESFPRNLLGLWTISGQKLLVLPRTQITGTPEVGRRVKGIALAFAEQPLVALQMEIEEPQPAETVPTSPTPWLGPHPIHTPKSRLTVAPGPSPSPVVTVPPIRTLLPIPTIRPRRTPHATPTPLPQPTTLPETTATPQVVDLAEATPTPMPTGIGQRAGR